MKIQIVFISVILVAVIFYLISNFKNKENFISFDEHMKNPSISFDKFKNKVDEKYFKESKKKKEKKKKKKKKKKKENKKKKDKKLLNKLIPIGVLNNKNIENFENYQEEQKLKKNISNIKEIIHEDKDIDNKGPSYPYLNNNTLVPNEYYNGNEDLDYEMTRKKSNIYSDNNLGPISQPNIGKKNINTYKVPALLNSTRNPAPGSTKENYIIPNPSTKPILKSPNENNLKVDNSNTSILDESLDNSEEESLLDEKENSININNSINNYSSLLSSQPCKFIGSYKKNAKCPSGFRNYTGISMGVQGNNIMCNNKKIKNSRAKAIPIVKDGKIEEIIVTNGGNNYKKEPQVDIIGVGKNALAKANIENGKVKNIIISNQGEGYTSSPKIEIDVPSGYVYCHLCCNL